MPNTDFSHLRGLYWFIRYFRPFHEAKRRRYYRLASKERARLISIGYEPETVRVACRAFAQPRNKNAQARFESLLQSMGGIGGQSPMMQAL